ncbi:lipoprotein export ABC superfamily ATP binding cassette transporter, membrane protein [Neisseria shayeganii 871]|uniref:Lipoprotein export ABC superfamily ATP binding cassette transporter, membrane protein n=2 Tax=Neisseria shayeganii TaxID=607712 RepID=G4CFX5_9NEIS|nr:lipoprotein export ABC superfamily ATP binding cassette transporter, membrane protein [Neisseria shayeganii 871]
MMASLETWIGLRYLRAKKRSGFVSLISIISILGIAVGVMALIVVLSVMNGFQKEVRGQLLQVTPHMQMMYLLPEESDNWHGLAEVAQQSRHVAGVAPYVSGQALLANAGEVQGVQVKGIDPAEENKVSEYGSKFPSEYYARLRAGEFDMILGRGLAEHLGVNEGEKVTLISPDGNVTPVGMVPRMKQFTVVAVVDTGIFAVDNSLSVIHIDDAKVLYRAGDADVGLQVRLKQPENAPEISGTVVPAAQQDKIMVRDWTFQNRDYFQAVAVEKRMMFIIMFFISLVASINLISTLIMTVTEKQSAIAILRTLGVPPRGIMKIFFVQGSLLGVIGTFWGVVFGLLIAFNVSHIVAGIETLAGRKLVTSAIYFIDYMPSQVKWSDVAVIVAISLGLSFLVTLYPSWRASKTQPAEALRYE